MTIPSTAHTPSLTPLSPDTPASTISLDDFSDSQEDLNRLEHAVEELPDSHPETHPLSPVYDSPSASVSDLRQSLTQTTGHAVTTETEAEARQRQTTSVEQQIAILSPRTQPWQLQDFLNISGQTLGVASSASSAGFSLAREATALSLNIAKRVTQVAVALPAMAIDAAAGTPPGSRNATAATIAHQSVGGFFDLISTLALGGIELGSALTSAGLGAASTGVEGLRRSLGSEVVKALGQFVKLVQREWNAEDDCLPPGGIPGFGLTGVTRALIVWICIQMVTREAYEKRMLKELQEIDIDGLRSEIEEEQRAAAARTPQPGDTAGTTGIPGVPVRQVRITSETSDQAGGEVIGAEIGSSEGGERSSDIGGAPSLPIGPLSNKEAMQGLLRYSSMVLAVYGGTALAWLGRLPHIDGEAARAAPFRGTSTDVSNGPSAGLSTNSALPSDGLTREEDEEQFLEAAAMMDLPEEDREDLSRRLEREREKRRMPGGFSGIDDGSPEEVSSVVFSADEPFIENRATQAGGAPGTPTGRSKEAGPRTDMQNVHGSSTAGEAPTRSYSYLNIISGEHDEELFHRVSRLQREHVQTGSYLEDRPHSSSPHEEEESRAPPIYKGPRIPRPSKPRYYIVTDHKSRKIILVLRGSLTLGDIAADLTCESREFYFPDPVARGEVSVEKDPQEAPRSSSIPFPAEEASTSARAGRFIDMDQSDIPLVHEGMYETALGVGSINRPVHRAVRSALLAQPGYDLDIAGHSLGAGVASLLAIMWANPETTLTTQASGLPPGRRLHSYCYACPATMSASLGRRCSKIITSYVYSYDFICRLSLGSIQDIRNAAAWILWEDQQESLRQRTHTRSHHDPSSSDHGSSSSSSSSGFDPTNRSTPLRVPTLLTRAFEHQAGRLDSTPEIKANVELDFLTLRKTLEANMRNVELFVPGQLLYLFQGQDFLVEQEKEEVVGVEREREAGGRNRGENDQKEEVDSSSSDLPPSPLAPDHPNHPRPKMVPGKKQRGFILRPASHLSNSTSNSRSRTRTSSSAQVNPRGESMDSGGRIEKVFDQVIFSRNLLSCHMPNVYDAALKGLI